MSGEFQPPDPPEEDREAMFETWCDEKEKCGYVVVLREELQDRIDRECTDAYAEGRKDESEDWTPVTVAMPECNGETVFIGVNTNGFAACFNHINPDGVCVMGGPESSTAQMSELAFWRALEFPARSSNQWREIQQRHRRQHEQG